MVQMRRHVLSLRRSSKKTWHYIVVEPFLWLFYCFFQPLRFRSEFEVQSFWKRIVPMLRLALPIFFLTYPFSFAVQLILSSSFHSRGGSSVPDFLLTTAWTAFISVGWGTAVGMIGGIAADLSLGIMLGTALSIGSVIGNSGLGIIVGITAAIALGVIGGIVRGIAWGIKGGLVGSLVGGIAWAGAWFIAVGTIGAIGGGVEVTSVFLVSYMVGYYRLPLYPVSGISGLKAFFDSKKDPVRLRSSTPVERYPASCCGTRHKTGSG